jgi:acetolactate synthase-1/2/3 large subunit
MDKIKASDALFAYLRSLGVTKVFGVPGGGCMHLYNAAYNTPGISLVPAFHEQAAGFAAQSYSELTGSLAVCLVTAGPGMTNIVTALAACWIESTPVLFIGGQAKTADSAKTLGVRSLGQQEVDGEAIARPLTKLSLQLTSGEQLAYNLPLAVRTAMSGRRGPVFLEIPLDVQAALLDGPIQQEVSEPKAAVPNLCEAELKSMLEALEHSKKPAMLIGAGVLFSQSKDAIISFCERHGIAMLLTWKALQLLPEDHQQNFGRPGGICQPYANDILQGCDLFISIGARNDLVSVAFDYNQYAMDAISRYFIDIDKNELKKYNLDKDHCIEADAEFFIRQLTQLEQKLALPVSDRSSWLEVCRRLKEEKHIFNFHPEHDGFVSTYRLIDCLSDEVSQRHVLIPGSSGSCSDIFMQSFRVTGPVKIQNAPGLGAMGTCLPAITGAHLACDGERQVVAIVGDGGFQFNLQELQTIKNLDINCVIFVLNNDGYASIRRSQKNHFDNNVHTNAESGVKLTPLRYVAQLFTFRYVRLESNQQTRDQMRELLSSSGQTLVEVMVHPDEDVRPRVAAKIVDGRIVSGNMRDYK